MTHVIESPRVGEALDNGESPARHPASTWERFTKIPKRMAPVVWRLGALGLLSATTAVGMSTVMPAESQCGPHRCEVSPAFDGNLTIDGGPLGGARLLMEDYPSSFGANVRVKEINHGLLGEESAIPTDLSQELTEADLERVAQAYSTVADDTEQIARDYTRHLAGLTGISAAGYGALYGLLGRRRRQEICDTITSHKLRSAALAGTLVIASLYAVPSTTTSQGWHSTEELFDGTPLEGMEVKGAFFVYSLNGIRQVLDYQEELEESYEAIGETARWVVENDLRLRQYANNANYRVVLRTSDIHCNYGMNAVLVAIAQAANANIWVDTGDMVVSGSTVEYVCIDALARNMPEQRLVVPGNHESDDSIGQFESAGFTVMDGSVVEVDGLRFIGLPDPNRSPFGAGTVYDSDKTRRVGRQLLPLVCREEITPIVLVHSTDMAKELVQAGCATDVRAGHAHRESTLFIPTQDGRMGRVLVAGTSGGARSGSLSIGELKDSAYVYLDVQSVDSEVPSELVASFRVSVQPDSSVDMEAIVIHPGE